MNIAKLRNTTFNKCEFNNLRFNKLPQLEKDLSEGYDFQLTEIKFPIIENDPSNVYSSIQTGYCGPMISLFAAYDKKLHYKYRQIVKNKQYHHANIYEAFGDLEIYCVNFNDSFFKENEFNKTNFRHTNCNQSICMDCQFINIEFTEGLLNNCMFLNCTFEKCNFTHIGFIDTIFNKCHFTKPYFRESSLYMTFNKCTLTDMIFQSSLLAIDKYHIFNQCKIDKYELSMCSHHDGRLLSGKDLDKQINHE